MKLGPLQTEALEAVARRLQSLRAIDAALIEVAIYEAALCGDCVMHIVAKSVATGWNG